MPSKVITLRRWQVVLAFVLVTAAFVFAILRVDGTSKEAKAAAATANAASARANTVALQAKLLAEDNRRLARALVAASNKARAIRQEEFKAVHKAQVEDCQGLHKLVGFAEGQYRLSIVQLQRAESQGVKTLAGFSVRELLARNIVGLAKLKRADCTGTPPLPTKLPPLPEPPKLKKPLPGD